MTLGMVSNIDREVKSLYRYFSASSHMLVVLRCKNDSVRHFILNLVLVNTGRLNNCKLVDWDVKPQHKHTNEPRHVISNNVAFWQV